MRNTRRKNNVKKKKLFGIVAALTIGITLFSVGSYYNQTKNVELKQLGAAETEYNTKYNGNSSVNSTEPDYTIPDYTADDIIAEACMYKNARTWQQGQVGYNDAWNAEIAIADKTEEPVRQNTQQWSGYNVGQLDCSGFVYATLRHIGIRLTGFFDGTDTAVTGRSGRFGPVPLSVQGWVENNQHLPYHIKWINGKDIARITKYTQRNHYDESSKSYIMDCSYPQWIEKENIAPGTIVACPLEGSAIYAHMWIYIGKFENQQAVEAYLNKIIAEKKGAGQSIEGLQIETSTDENASNHWSIECRGDKGVIVTNRDPAAKSDNKEGFGFVGYTLFNKKVVTGSYHMNVVKRSAKDFKGKTEQDIDLTDKTNAVAGIKFKLTQQVRGEDGNLTPATNKTPTTVAGQSTPSGFGETTIFESGIGVNKHDIYTIEETEVPSEYQKLDLSGITINVYKKQTDDGYCIDYVRADKNGREIGRAQSYTGNVSQKVMDINGDGTWDLGLEVNNKGTAFTITVIDEEVTGTFNIKLIKYLKGTKEKLSGAGFDFKVEKVVNGKVEGQPIYTKTGITNGSGEINVKGVTIGGENEEYKITATEQTPPAGYIGIDGPIVFNVKTTKVNDELVLLKEGNGDITVANAKKVHVEPGEILIEAENRTTGIDIHKGVKTVENQDSGYYANKKDSEYVDETTGKTYTEIELEEIYHDWVVETTIPEGVSKYKKYLITDPIDLSKLDFAGLDRVTVERVDKAGKVIEKLTNEKDYKAEYDEKTGILTVTYINEKDGNNFHGTLLTDEGVKSRPGIENTKIRVTFNTTFKVNENGKLAVLDGAVTNAENKSTLIYDNGSGKEEEKESEIPEVHTGAVSLFKYEDTNGNGKHDEGEKALVGAEFRVALTEEDAKAGKFLRIDGKELMAISNEHGIATFVGLSFGGDAIDDEKNLQNGLYSYDWETASRAYYIVETKTPEGYEKVQDIIKVTVSKNSSEIIDLTDKINEMESVGNKPMRFDLALRKWVTQAIVTENGKTVVHETGHKAEDNPEDVVKVDLKKSKIKDVTVKFKYSIRVTNEGEIAGEAQEITDYIPEGLKFVKEDNPYWETTENPRIVKTDKLKGVTLEPKESTEVEIILTWVNSEKSMGVMINTAEISKDYNKFGVHDIDSIPNNRKPKEDDIDDAPVMLTVKTGAEIIAYITIALGTVTVISVGVAIIKKKFRNI